MRTATALVLALLAPLLLASRADALGLSDVTGTPGGVTVNLAMTAAYEQQNSAAGYPRLFQTNGMNVRRSAASSNAQTVYVRYVLQRYENGAWYNLNTTDYWGTVSGSGSLNFPSWAVAPTQSTRFALPHRFIYVMAWSDNVTRRTLATQTIFPNRTNENACFARFRRCTVYSDSVVI